jgi:hypothetical protein
VEGVVLQAGSGGRYGEEDLARVADAESFVISHEPVHEQHVSALEEIELAAQVERGAPGRGDLQPKLQDPYLSRPRERFPGGLLQPRNPSPELATLVQR